VASWQGSKETISLLNFVCQNISFLLNNFFINAKFRVKNSEFRGFNGKIEILSTRNLLS